MDLKKTSAQVPKVEMNSINKRFGEVQALIDANFTLLAGEVHSILGENGAGKTTLMNVLSGLYKADSGEILISGEPVHIQEPKDANAHGVGMVHQHFELINNFTALENIIIGKEGDRRILDLSAQRKKVEQVMNQYGLPVDLDQKVKNLAIGVQQKVEILKALYHGAKILILDEPTTMLTPQEVDLLFEVINSLVEKQLSVVIITHKIKEVLSISNRITIMRRGRVVSVVNTADVNQQDLVELMMGEKRADGAAEQARPSQKAATAETLVKTKHIDVRDDSGNLAARQVSIHVRAYEMVGLVGVGGNGQREVAECLLGMKPAASGEIWVKGENLTHTNIRQRILAGVSLIPEDRIRQGILSTASLAHNLILGPHHKLFGKSILFDHNLVKQLSLKAIQEYQILAPNEEIETRSLSGGNIQKVIVARAFLQSTLVDPVLMIAFNPTRGLDVMSSEFIHSKLYEYRDSGAGVLLISEDLDESMLLCDRIYVMYKGEVVAEFQKDEFDAYKIGSFMSISNQERAQRVSTPAEAA
jgi:simple sugar transport system ATP-binding protein